MNKATVAALDKFTINALPERPPDVFTVQEYAKEKEIKIDTATSRLYKWKSEGLLEIVHFYFTGNNGRRYIATGFRLAKQRGK